jgi:hypothetical protein
VVDGGELRERSSNFFGFAQQGCGGRARRGQRGAGSTGGTQQVAAAARGAGIAAREMPFGEQFVNVARPKESQGGAGRALVVEAGCCGARQQSLKEMVLAVHELVLGGEHLGQLVPRSSTVAFVLVAAGMMGLARARSGKHEPLLAHLAGAGQAALGALMRWTRGCAELSLDQLGAVFRALGVPWRRQPPLLPPPSAAAEAQVHECAKEAAAVAVAPEVHPQQAQAQPQPQQQQPRSLGQLAAAASATVTCIAEQELKTDEVVQAEALALLAPAHHGAAARQEQELATVQVEVEGEVEGEAVAPGESSPKPAGYLSFLVDRLPSISSAWTLVTRAEVDAMPASPTGEPAKQAMQAPALVLALPNEQECEQAQAQTQPQPQPQPQQSHQQEQQQQAPPAQHQQAEDTQVLKQPLEQQLAVGADDDLVVEEEVPAPGESDNDEAKAEAAQENAQPPAKLADEKENHAGLVSGWLKRWRSTGGSEATPLAENRKI